MARSSTDRGGLGGALWRRPVLLALWFSALLHVALIGWLYGTRAPVQRPVATPPRGLSVQWVKPAAAPVRTSGCGSDPCGSGFSRDAGPSTRPSRLKPLPQEQGQESVRVDRPVEAPAPVAEAASAPPAGIDWAPQRIGGFASRWGRPPVKMPVDDDAARLAQQQSIRMAAQQQQAMAELAWRTQAAVAANRASTTATTAAAIVADALRPPADPAQSSP